MNADGVTSPPATPRPSSRGGVEYILSMERLLHAVQELSLARSMPDVQRIVRSAARELTGCDGATFVLRDDNMCYYAD